MAVGMAGSWKLDIQRSVQAGPLAGLRAGFEAELERSGYSPATALGYLRRFAQLSCWMQSEGLGSADFSPAVLERFGAACRAAGYRDYVSIRGDKPMLAFLLATGRCSVEPVVSGPVDELLDRFAGWLSRERHLAPESVVTYVWHARALVERLVVGDRIELSGGWTPRSCGGSCWTRVRGGGARRRRSRSSRSVNCSRSSMSGEEIDRPLVGAVPSVAGARLSGLPKRLGLGEVQRMLGCVRSRHRGWAAEFRDRDVAGTAGDPRRGGGGVAAG